MTTPFVLPCKCSVDGKPLRKYVDDDGNIIGVEFQLECGCRLNWIDESFYITRNKDLQGIHLCNKTIHVDQTNCTNTSPAIRINM